MFFIGIFIHLVFLFSIFDIYFKSPIVKNANTYQPLHEPPAERLVLFVIDGLRAESFVNYTTMPYLRSVANSHGRWGISNTRVPTESRPGHVAIIAGFYEDPSAIAKGWKENPVDFDSVFNQSAYTWSWGTYDIVDIFTKGAVKNNIFVEKFDPYDQTFSSDKNTTLLDDWVFTRVKDFFQKGNNKKELREKLQTKKILFFLHLLGTDTSGHTHKPKTKNFLTTIKFVDENIKEIEQVIRDFYNDDGKTTFLMTSDHGMTDWGSHGTGDNDETKTPYVLWGAGVQQVTDKLETLDPETLAMSIENRYDINQADLAPLMSTFISIPVPVNSVGQLPSGLLEMSLPNKAKAIYSNCRQMISQYNKKRLDVEASAIKILYQPYEPFDGKKVEEIISFTEKLLEEEQYDKIIKLSEEIMYLSLSGLTYYHNYYQTPLLITVTFSFLGWIMYLLRFLVEQKMFAQTEMPRNKNQRLVIVSQKIDRFLKVFAVFVSLLLSFMIYVQSLPVQYYVYFLMPILLWYHALTPVKLWIQTLNLLQNKRRIYFLGIEILCYTLGSVSLGLALTHRWVLSVPLFGMGLWPFLSASVLNLPRLACVAWPVGCVSLSVFSFMSVIGKETSIELVVFAGLIWLFIHIMHIWKCLLPNSEDQDVMREIITSIIQIVLLAVSLQIIYFQARRFEENFPISQTLQTVCWAISVLLPLIPLLYTTKFINRLLGINTAILNFYLLLSVAHEGLFMVTMILNVNCWMFIEFKLINSKDIKIYNCAFTEESTSNGEKNLTAIERTINGQDFRRAFFFNQEAVLVSMAGWRHIGNWLFLKKLSPVLAGGRLRPWLVTTLPKFSSFRTYFGTGNIASLNSFEVRWVLCFTTSFQPFIITGLILLKTLAPFLSVACTLRSIQYFTRAPSGCLNIIVLIYSNIMGLHMLYHVKNTGSWLEIGTSISQYIIVQVITLFIVLINKIAKVLTEIEIHTLIMKLFKNRKKYV